MEGIYQFEGCSQKLGRGAKVGKKLQIVQIAVF